MGDVRIIGTAHVSQKSVEEVQRGIDEFQPTIVALELDEIRYLLLSKKVKPLQYQIFLSQVILPRCLFSGLSLISNGVLEWMLVLNLALK
jgi:pheromone shutdown protein TraB